MNFKLECPRCDEPFDTISRMPRMLIDCGHTICGKCLKDLKNSRTGYTCPDDNKVCFVSINKFNLGKECLISTLLK